MSGPEGSFGYHGFFRSMEEFGFLDHIYDHLPEAFTAVFEIARILEDPDHPLTVLLAPVLAPVGTGSSAPHTHVDERGLPIIEDPLEYEAELIRNPRDLPHMYHQQWLYPEDHFWRKLAKKELWAPYPRKPRVFPVDPDENAFHPDGRKQKVYMLLDTSSSMRLHQRIHLAKAVTFHFLHRNLRELGYISLRTFDTEVHELQEAKDHGSYEALIRYIMRLHTLGNGTALGKAISQAIEDIRALPRLAGTEILIITDGACALQEERLRRELGDSIVIHTVKIGGMQVFASKSLVHDKIFREDTAQHRRIAEIQDGLAALEGQLRRAHSDHLRHRLERAVEHTRAELQRQVDAMTEEIVVGYGHELERLSQLFITIPDLDTGELFPMTEERVSELTELLHNIENRMEATPSTEDLRQLALLSDHLAFLHSITRDASMRSRLMELKTRIMDVFARSRGRARSTSQPNEVFNRLSPEDRHDLAFLLERAGSKFALGPWQRMRELLRQLIQFLRPRR